MQIESALFVVENRCIFRRKMSLAIDLLNLLEVHKTCEVCGRDVQMTFKDPILIGKTKEGKEIRICKDCHKNNKR